MNYTYLLRCADGTLYCGWTNHLAARVAAHNAGKGAKYTKTRCPVVLAYYEEYATRSEAMRREAAIKKLTKKEKRRWQRWDGRSFRWMTRCRYIAPGRIMYEELVQTIAVKARNSSENRN